MEQGVIPGAPIWDDLRTFNGKPWRGAVDIVTAGYPCQPFSVAGRKRGSDDPRHMWLAVARIVEECRAPFVFLENVSRHLTAGFDQVAGDLHSMGYTVAALVCRASTLDAPHQRERLFALAVSNTDRERVRELTEWVQGNATEPAHMGENVANPDGVEWIERCLEREPKRAGSDQPSQTLADGYRGGFQGERRKKRRRDWENSQRDESNGCSGAELADSDSKQCESGTGRQRAGRRDQFGYRSCWPPGPNDVEQWRWAPDFARPSIESALCRVADGLSDWMGFRREQLHALGNAVVPVQAAYAFITLVEALDECFAL